MNLQIYTSELQKIYIQNIIINSYEVITNDEDIKEK